MAPHPPASSDAIRRKMERQLRRDTAPEIALRRELHRLGLRYFVDRSPLPDVRLRADVVFPGARLAVFVDGCFWHGCPKHASWPKANAEWWRQKIEGNRRRDTDNDHRLQEAGWFVLRVWEHEEPMAAARAVAAEVLRRNRA